MSVQPTSVGLWRRASAGFAAALLVAASTPCMAEGGPSRAALGFFAGTWTIRGHEASYRERCDWLPGAAFLACRSVDRSDEPPSHGLSIFGYLESDGLYTYHGFGGSGSQRNLRGGLQDGVWRFYGDSGRGPEWRRWQVVITPTPGGFSFREEVSDRGGPWRESVALEFLRLERD